VNIDRDIPHVVLSAQSLAPGNGGVCAVGRMTATALADRCELTALACQDKRNHEIGSVQVRSFDNRRISFVTCNMLKTRWATHFIYDHAGTARAHLKLPISRRPYAVWLHGWEIWENPPPKYLRAIAGASLLLANSAYTIERGRRALPAGIEVRTCPLGTPEDTPPASIGPSGGSPTVLLLGRVDELFAKGHDILIEIWPKIVSAVPDARLLFVGGGNSLEKLRGLAAASPARAAIEIAGFVPDENLDAYWRRATMFAMPGFAEGFGLVYIDAMRRGLPIVASTDDASHEVNLDGVTGFNVARSDKKRLTEIIVDLLRDRDKAKRFGESGHALWRKQYRFSSFSQRLHAATAGFLSSGIQP